MLELERADIAVGALGARDAALVEIVDRRRSADHIVASVNCRISVPLAAILLGMTAYSDAKRPVIPIHPGH